MKVGFRIPSLKKRIAVRTSVKRYVRHSLGLKAPRGWGWLTNPSRAASSRTTRGCVVLDVGLPPEDQGLLPSLWRQDSILSKACAS